MDRPLGAAEAPQLLLLSAPFSACRAPPHDSAARESSSVLPVEYSSLSRELRAAGPGSQLHTRWRRRDGPPARPARRCRAVSVRFKRSGPPAGTNDTSVGLYTIFSNIFENIEGPAHFHIREYSREYRCPGRLFPQEYTSFPQPLTLVDLESKDILEYS